MRKGWEYKRWKEVLTIINGKNQSAVVDENGEYPIYGSGGIMGYANNWLCPENCVIIGRKGNINKPIFVETKFWNVDTAFGLNANKEYLLPKFLYYFCLDYNFERHNKAVTIPSLTKADLLKIDIPLPPKSTQLAIVSELDKINELIRLKKEQLKDFGNLAQSLFYEMFGDPVENEKGWEVKKLKDISREIGDGLHGTPEYSEVDTGCYFINGNNLENGTIVIKENTKMVSEKTKAKHYIEMDDFTILVSINGTLGKVAFYNGENVILGKSACYIKLEAYNDKKYIFELLKSDYFKRYAESECTGTTIRNVSLKSMRNFRCPLPPLPLQRLFAQRIEQIEREKSEVQKSIQDLETLLASRMQYWFE